MFCRDFLFRRCTCGPPYTLFVMDDVSHSNRHVAKLAVHENPRIFLNFRHLSTVAHKCNGETKSHGKTNFNSRHNKINLQSNETSRQNKTNSRQNNIN